MNKKIQKISGYLLIIIISVLVGFYIYSNASLKDGAVDVSEEAKGQEKEVIIDIAEDGTIKSADKDYKIEIVPAQDSVSMDMPDLDRKIVFADGISDEARVIIMKNIEKLTKELKENSDLFQNWIDLGMQMKIAGEYKGARDVWEYAGAIRPQNSLSFRNLGDLYGYYLEDNKKAEENFLKAIENGPDQIEYYFKTADFYRKVMKDPVRARAIVEQGIESNPDSKELKELLVSLE